MKRYLGIALKYMLSRFWTHKPVILTHSVTSRCNCRCKMCNLWMKPLNNNEMNKSEVFRMLDEAKDLNFAAYLVWGGEPLMRPDVFEILQHARKNDFYTSLITNGILLPENAERLAELVDLTFVSLDHYSEYHDVMRGQKGTFKKAVKGIIKLRNAGGRVAINCVLSKMNQDSAMKMVELARLLGVKIAFDQLEVFAGYNEELALTTDEKTGAFQKIQETKNYERYVLNSSEYLQHTINHTKYSCAQPSIYLVVTEDGKVTPFWCQKTNSPLGDLRKQSLGEILNSKPLKQFTELSKGCSLCGNSVTVETSIYYSARRFFTNFYKWNNPYLKFLADFAF
ncbi:MAG: radical SAM protein [Candidatus Bathyarchaeia archaeon]